MFNFVDRFLDVTKIVESPTSYLIWSAYVTIGAVMRHNVYVDFPSRRTKVTPNLYVLLVGDSGATRKSTPLKITNFLLKRVNNTKLIEGRASIQGVLKELSEVKRVDRNMIKYAAALLYSEEFAGFLVKDPATTAILTDIYDFKDNYEIILKSDAPVKLENVSVSILSATNAAFIQDMFNKTDLYGGLVGRTFFIVEEKARHKNLGLKDATIESDWEPLIDHLKMLSKLQGPAILTPEAADYFENWYDSTDFAKNESKTGYEHRAHTHALKLALIFAACEGGFNLQIHKSHCEKAIITVTDLNKNYHKMVATIGFTNNDTRQAIKDVTRVLYERIGVPITREEILSALFGHIDSESLDKAMITLEQTGMVKLTGTSVAKYQLSVKGENLILGAMQTKGKVQ